MNKNIILVLVVVSFSLFAKAQGNFDLQVGGSFPIGNFADNGSETGGSASTGLNIGIKYLHPVSTVDGLSVTGGINWFYHGINQTAKDNFRKEGITSGVSDLTINYLSYINVPVLVGVNYQLPVDKTFAIFGDAAFGINYSKVTDMSMLFQYNGTGVKATETFDPLIGMAFQVGAGLLILKQYTVDLHYDLLGSYAYNGKTTTTALGQTQKTDDPASGKTTVSTLNLTVGIRF